MIVHIILCNSKNGFFFTNEQWSIFFMDSICHADIWGVTFALILGVHGMKKLQGVLWLSPRRGQTKPLLIY